MAKLLIASDLHLGFHDTYKVICQFNKVDVDYMIFAGDVATSPEEVANFFNSLKTSAKIIYVLGNHEFHGWRFPGSIEYYRKALKNVILLEKETFVENGLTFIGTTLWTDYDGGLGIGSSFGMIDFEFIRTDDDESIYPHVFVEENRKSVRFLKNELEKDGKKIVITHHAPSWSSVDPKFLGDRLNSCFVNNLDSLISIYQPELWVHGHVHCGCDYRLGETRVVCNPYGYYGKDYQHLIVEV